MSADLAGLASVLAKQYDTGNTGQFTGYMQMQNQKMIQDLLDQAKLSEETSRGYTQAQTDQLREAIAKTQRGIPLEELQNKLNLNYLQGGGDTEDMAKVKKENAQASHALAQAQAEKYKEAIQNVDKGIQMALGSKNPALAKQFLALGVQSNVFQPDVLDQFDATPMVKKGAFLSNLSNSLRDTAEQRGKVFLEEMKQKGENARASMANNKPSDQATAEMLRMIHSGEHTKNPEKFQALALAAGGGRANVASAEQRQVTALTAHDLMAEKQQLLKQLSNTVGMSLMPPAEQKKLTDRLAEVNKQLKDTVTKGADKPIPKVTDEDLLSKYAD